MQYDLQDNGVRRRVLGGVKRVVIKIGTRLLMDIRGEEPSRRIQQLIDQVASLRSTGIDVVLVTSGAIGAGMLVLDTKRRPKRMEALQAHAAVGQCHLMALYEAACLKNGFHCAQLLLTAADLQDHERHLKVSLCMDELINSGVLPIVNENDSVCVDEIKVGDNDTLAAYVASICRADCTILLTTVQGFCESKDGKLGRRISVVNDIDSDLLSMANGTDGNRFSVGGMATKLHAALINTTCGEPLLIADGADFAILKRIFAGEDCGTLFMPKGTSRMHAHQRFLALFSSPKGEIIVDEGAEEALCRHGKSLLPIGVIGMKGVFSAGETVIISNCRRREIGRGTVNFGTAELSKICGRATSELKRSLGYEPQATEVIHRNALVLTGWNIFDGE